MALVQDQFGFMVYTAVEMNHHFLIVGTKAIMTIQHRYVTTTLMQEYYVKVIVIWIIIQCGLEC